MNGFSLKARFPKASSDFLAANADLLAPKPPTVIAPKPQKSPLAVKFEQLWEVINGPAYETELPVVGDRRWRFDYAWPEAWVALELQGGIYLVGRGGHVAPKRFQNDCDKFNRAVCAGWRPCKLATGQVTPENLLLIKELVLQMHTAPEGWRQEQDRLFAVARQTGKACHEQAAQQIHLP